jgi:hypothetical protein
MLLPPCQFLARPNTAPETSFRGYIEYDSHSSDCQNMASLFYFATDGLQAKRQLLDKDKGV